MGQVSRSHRDFRGSDYVHMCCGIEWLEYYLQHVTGNVIFALSRDFISISLNKSTTCSCTGGSSCSSSSLNGYLKFLEGLFLLKNFISLLDYTKSCGLTTAKQSWITLPAKRKERIGVLRTILCELMQLFCTQQCCLQLRGIQQEWFLAGMYSILRVRVSISKQLFSQRIFPWRYYSITWSKAEITD